MWSVGPNEEIGGAVADEKFYQCRKEFDENERKRKRENGDGFGTENESERRK